MSFSTIYYKTAIRVLAFLPSKSKPPPKSDMSSTPECPRSSSWTRLFQSTWTWCLVFALRPFSASHQVPSAFTRNSWECTPLREYLDFATLTPANSWHSQCYSFPLELPLKSKFPSAVRFSFTSFRYYHVLYYFH